jgi:hypothetical protein
MTPDAMAFRRQLAVRLRRDENLTYREIGARLGCSHTAVRLFVEAPEKPLKWDRKGTQGRAWDEATAQERRAERERRKLGLGAFEYAHRAVETPAITVEALGDQTPDATVTVPDPYGVNGRRLVWWATSEARQRVSAYVAADPRRCCTTTALIKHCRLVELAYEQYPVRPDLEAVLWDWGYVLSLDGGWRRG